MLLQHCKVCLAALAATAALQACGAGPAAASPVAPACHGQPTPYRIVVTAEGVRTNHGYLVANLAGTDRRKWLQDDGWLAVWQDPAVPGDQIMCFYVSAPGRYALVVFHDANADGELNLGPLGPKEGYGFSNNVRPFLAPPPLSSALFTVSGPETRLTIRLRYPPIS